MTANYYEILDVDIRATQEEIKKSFRRKVMEHHPDRNPDRKTEAEEKIRIIIEAYRVLSDPEQRLVHDEKLTPGEQPRQQTETIWDRLRRQTYDPAAKVRLILYELLEGNGSQAVDIYEDLLERYVHFDLLPYLSLKDYLDCKFLLAEEYERQGQLKVALEMYKEVFKEELELPRLCFFFDEVKIRLRNLYCRDLVKGLPPDEALDYYEEALNIGFDKQDKALIYKRMAECHWKRDDLVSARAALTMAFRCQPKIKGVQRICQKLGMTPPKAS